MSAPAELAGIIDSRGWSAPAPIEHPIHGVVRSVWVAPRHLAEAAQGARDAGYFFESMTCVDRLEAHRAFELIYTFNRWEPASRLAFRVWAPRDEAVPSLAGLYSIAAWNEREAWEFYGLGFAGHPNLTWLLLPEGTEFRPLLKSFTAPPPSLYDDSLNPEPALDDDAGHAAGH